jgi:hypothetical protein
MKETHKTNYRKLAGLLCLTILLVVALYGVGYQLSHPDLTKTRVFLDNWLLLPVVLGCMAGVKWLLLEERP